MDGTRQEGPGATATTAMGEIGEISDLPLHRFKMVFSADIK
jgi:hypothetical protein